MRMMLTGTQETIGGPCEKGRRSCRAGHATEVLSLASTLVTFDRLLNQTSPGRLRPPIPLQQAARMASHGYGAGSSGEVSEAQVMDAVRLFVAWAPEMARMASDLRKPRPPRR